MRERAKWDAWKAVEGNVFYWLEPVWDCVKKKVFVY
jgi:hypothetical protein